MARANEGSHSFTCQFYTFIYEWAEPSWLYSPAAEHHRILAPVLMSRPANGKRLSWPGWLVSGYTTRWYMPVRRRSPIPVL